MEARDRAAFVNDYSKLVTAVWSDEAFARRLESDPKSAAAEHGLTVPAGSTIQVVRDAEGEPNLDTQVDKWEEGKTTGTYILYVPRSQRIEAGELSEADLEAVAGGDFYCCCTPCCTCT